MNGNASLTQLPRLLARRAARSRLKHYSIRTEQAYVDWIKRFVLHFDKRHPAEMGAPEVTGEILVREGKGFKWRWPNHSIGI